jgi:hypothetical protein
MKREIEGIIYDTAHARVIASHEAGSTHVHRMSSLYRSAEGRYFVVEEKEVHGVDGALLTPLTDSMARLWLDNHGKAEIARGLFKNGRIFLRIELDSALLGRIDAAAEVLGLSEQAWILAAIERELAASATVGAPRIPEIVQLDEAKA